MRRLFAVLFTLLPAPAIAQGQSYFINSHYLPVPIVATDLPTVPVSSLAAIAANSFICNNTGASAVPIACSAVQATAILVPMVGDSGSGGVQGLAPAPAAGDQAAGKFLAAGGSYQVPNYPSNPLTGALIGILEDQKTSGTAAGNSVATTWTTRALTTKVYDRSSNITLNTNQFTLVAGSYAISWSCPFASDGASSPTYGTRLQNITDSSTVQFGGSVGALPPAVTTVALSNGLAVVTIASSKAFAVQYWAAAVTTNGLGSPATTGSSEIYCRVAIYNN